MLGPANEVSQSFGKLPITFGIGVDGVALQLSTGKNLRQDVAIAGDVVFVGDLLVEGGRPKPETGLRYAE